MKLTIDIGWPKQVLWPNGSEGSRRYKGAAKKAARHDAHWLTKAAIQRGAERPSLANLGDPVPVIVAVHAKGRGKLPDRDNCVAVCKSYFDGIADALVIDDRHFREPVVEFREPRDGRIVIELGA